MNEKEMDLNKKPKVTWQDLPIWLKIAVVGGYIALIGFVFSFIVGFIDAIKVYGL